MICAQTCKPELLSPAGSREAFMAAIAAGADAVYLGLKDFNARRSAQNFSLDELADLCDFAHLSGVKVYLALNILILPDEFPEALDTVRRAWQSGIDAVIVQDLGLLSAIARTYPEVRIHASTQLGAHDSETICTLAAMGVSRVTLAREVSIEEIADFAAFGVEIESFAHGALCICYSGQCLMSSLIGRRSANRGMCAQPCRLAWELLDQEDEPIDAPGDYLLSPKDLNSLEVLPQLVEAGVSAIKIEGRMKSASYVSTVVATYRHAIDDALVKGEAEDLAEVFSRGFTTAYLTKERGNEMMGYSRPNNRGVLIGRVQELKGQTVTIAVEKDVRSDDTVEFWTKRGRFAQHVGEMRFAGAPVDLAPAGTRPNVIVKGAVSPGDRVFRVENALLTERAENRTKGFAGRPYELSAKVTVRVGEPLALELRDAQPLTADAVLDTTPAAMPGSTGMGEGAPATDERTAAATGSAIGAPVEAARTKPLMREDIQTHIGRLGGTPFRIVDWDIDLDENAGLGFSALHALRRDAVAALQQEILAPWHRRRDLPRIPAGDTQAQAHADLASNPAIPLSIPKMAVIADTPQVAKWCEREGIEDIFVPFDEYITGDYRGLRVKLLLPRICHDKEYPDITPTIEEGHEVVASTLGELALARKMGALPLANWTLNVTNPATANELTTLGAQRFWVSPELSGRQIAQVCSEADLPGMLTVYGYQEVMVMEHCVLMAQGPCNQKCSSCARRAQMHSLRDRKGYTFPLKTDVFGRSHLYNSVPLDLLRALPEVAAAGVDTVVIDTTLLPVSESTHTIERFRTALSAISAGVEPPLKQRDRPTTSGHFYRGVQ